MPLPYPEKLARCRRHGNWACLQKRQVAEIWPGAFFTQEQEQDQERARAQLLPQHCGAERRQQWR